LCQYMFNLPNPMDWAIDYRTLGAKTQITEHLNLAITINDSAA